MKQSEKEAMLRAVGQFVAEQIDKAVRPLVERLEAVESKGLEYRGAYARAEAYRRGAAVTHGGSLWIALRAVEPTEKPGASDAWQLAVKAGRDARGAT